MAVTPKPNSGPNSEPGKGTCPQCGALNPHIAVVCSLCYSRLPWAQAPASQSSSRQSPAQTATGARGAPSDPTAIGSAPRDSSSAIPAGTPSRTPGQPTAHEMGALLSAQKSDGSTAMDRRQFFGQMAGLGIGGLGIWFFLGRRLLGLGSSGRRQRSKEVDNFEPSIQDERGALQQLSSDLKEYPETPKFKERWMLKPAEGVTSAYPDLSYSRSEQMLIYNPDGPGGVTLYQVSEEAIHKVAAQGGSVLDLEKQGATRTPPATPVQ